MFKKIASVLLIFTLAHTQASALDRNDEAVQVDIPSLSGSLQNPAFSPDGESIAFTQFHDGYNEGYSSVHTYNLETGFLSSLIDNDSYPVNLPGSSWNVFKEAIVFSAASSETDHDEIFMIDDAGTTGDERQITAQANKQSYEPTFSNDGKWVVFESHGEKFDENGNKIGYKEDGGVITKHKIDGTEYIALTSENVDARQPNWSPAEDRILYQEKVGNAWTIKIMDSDGDDKTTVSRSDEDATDAVFSSDGDWIIYSAGKDGVEHANIFRKASESGGESIRVTNYCGYDGAPSISPDGRKIVFESAAIPGERTKIWIIDVGFAFNASSSECE